MIFEEELRSPTPPFEPQDRANQSSALTELVQPTRKSSSTDETDLENIVQEDFPIPKPEPPPPAKPLNKARVNDFATLLSSSIRLVQPPTLPNQSTPKAAPVTTRPPPSPARSEDQSFSSIPSAQSDREERESFHTVQSNNSEQEQPKKHIDARYNEKLDDRGSIKIKTANIKALFEQKISDTNKVLSQSNEHLLHQTEVRQQQQHKKIPVSYDSLRRNLPSPAAAAVPVTQRRQSYQDSSAMNKYSDHLVGAKDVVIEDKQVRKTRGRKEARRKIFDYRKENVYDGSDHVNMRFLWREININFLVFFLEQKERKDEELRCVCVCGNQKNIFFHIRLRNKRWQCLWNGGREQSVFSHSRADPFFFGLQRGADGRGTEEYTFALVGIEISPGEWAWRDEMDALIDRKADFDIDVSLYSFLWFSLTMFGQFNIMVQMPVVTIRNRLFDLQLTRLCHLRMVTSRNHWLPVKFVKQRRKRKNWNDNGRNVACQSMPMHYWPLPQMIRLNRAHQHQLKHQWRTVHFSPIWISSHPKPIILPRMEHPQYRHLVVRQFLFRTLSTIPSEEHHRPLVLLSQHPPTSANNSATSFHKSSIV